MASGRMRERVSFRRQARTQRDDGGWSTAESTFTTVWASVRPVAGRENENAGRLFGNMSYIVSVYPNEEPAELSTDWILRWETAPDGPVDFGIVSIRPARGRDMVTEIVGAAVDVGTG